MKKITFLVLGLLLLYDQRKLEFREIKLAYGKQATYYLGWKMGILNYNHYLRATIRSGFLSVTY